MSADPPTQPNAPSQSLADFRLGFSPSYVLVGVYRLSTDASLRVPVWKKCKHGFIRGMLAGLAWVCVRTTPPFLRSIVSPGIFHVWHSKEHRPTLPIKVRSVHMGGYDPPQSIHSISRPRSARVTGLSHRSVFGYPLPFELTTCTRLILSYPILILIPPFIKSP